MEDKYTNYKKLSKKDKALVILELLDKDYPEVYTPLLHQNEFELLIATILSTQTKDETTNTVTPELFLKYPNPKALSEANPNDIIPIIRLVNYNKTKAKNIVEASKMLMHEFGGSVPKTMEELTRLPGVGRKVANVVISEWFAKNGLVEPEGFVVDTHVIRVSNRLGLTKHKSPEKIEKDLMKLFPKEVWPEVSLQMIFHGREWSQAKNPKYYEHPRKEWREVYRSMGA